VLVSTIAVIVVGLVVAAILVIPHLRSDNAEGPDGGPISASPVNTGTPSPSAVALPPPVAFSDNTLQGTDPSAVLDNDPGTFWSTPASRTAKTDDSWIAIDMGGIATWNGLSITPRAGGSGFPRTFRIESSGDGLTWTTIPGQDYNSDHPFKPVEGAQTISFDVPVLSRYIRLFATQLGPVVTVNEAAAFNVFALQMAEMHVLR
jgi:hypothetical protein